MKVIRFFVIIALLAASVPSAQARGWEAGEEELIARSEYSRMAVLTIYERADSLFLRRTAQPVSREMARSPYMHRLIARMLLTVTDPADTGVGIAAPQVGISRRMIAVQRFDKEGEPFEVYLNPRIVSRSQECEVGPEGCLSVPGMRGNVRRSTSIEIEYRDPFDFGLHRERVEGFTAVIFQHEIDHLDGILYVDTALEIEKDSTGE